jgi:ABC-type lipoprotein export system ATPase subunit
MAAVEVVAASTHYGAVRALDGVSIGIERGEWVAIIGQSGSGKSTLMNVVGCLDTPTRGSYLLNGKDVARMSDDELAGVRNKEIGFIFQNFQLLPRETALANVELPLVYRGVTAKERRARAVEALAQRAGEGGRGDLASLAQQEVTHGQRRQHEQRHARHDHLSHGRPRPPDVRAGDPEAGNADQHHPHDVERDDRPRPAHRVEVSCRGTASSDHCEEHRHKLI